MPMEVDVNILGTARDKTLLEYSGCFDSQLFRKSIFDLSCKHVFAAGLLLCQP